MRAIFVFELVAALLAALAAGRYFSAPYRAEIPVLTVDHRDEREVQLQYQLKLPAKDWQFIEAPLTEVAKWLSEELQVPVHIDPAALEELRNEAEPIVTSDLSTYRRDVALTALTADLNLIWHIYHGEIFITTPALAQLKLDCCVYPVRNLVLLRNEHGEFDTGPALIEQLKHFIDPMCWESNGGECSMRYLATTKTLTVNATPETQRRIEAVLQALEETRASQGVFQPFYRPQGLPPKKKASGPGCTSIVPVVGACGF